MGTRIGRDSVVRLTPGYRLQWEPAQEAHVLLYPEGMVTLNASAGEILSRCNGARTVDDIIGDLQAQFPDAEIAGDTLEFLEVAHHEGWLRRV